MTDANSSIREKGGHIRSSIALVLIGLVIGGFGGATVANRTVSRNAQIICQTLALTEYQNLALLQYKYAGPDYARRSLQDLLNFMDQIEASQLAAEKDTLEFDRSLAYTRLALLDEKSGDIESAQAHIAAAAQSARKLGDKDASEAKLRQVVTRLDSYLP